MHQQPQEYTRETFLEHLATRLCNVTFNKKDGTRREMQCTRNPKFIPSEFHPKQHAEDIETPRVIRKENLEAIAVFDYSSNAWRSFRIDSVINFNSL